MNIFRYIKVLAVGLSLLASTMAVAAKKTEVNVAYLPLLGSAQLFVMENEGWAREAGLELKLTQFSSGAALNQALASGSFDVAVMALSPVIVARANGIDLKVISALHGVNSHAFIGIGDWADTFSAAATPAAAFATYHKKAGHPVRISTLPTGTLPDTAIKYYLMTNKVAKGDYKIINQGSDQVLQSILADATESVSLAEPLMTIISERKPRAKILAGGADLMPGHPGFVFAVRERFIAKHPGAAKDLANMVKRATLLIQKDPSRAAESVKKYIGVGLLDKQTIVKAFTSGFNPVAYNPRDIVEGTKLMQTFQLSIGSQARMVPVEELFDFSYYK